MKKSLIPFFVLIMVVFNSCIGLKIDIQMNKDGSGKVKMEYRISQTLSNIGNFEGNEHLPVIPVGRSDWQRTISRIEGARLSSYSSSKKGPDTVTTVVINYSNPEALIAILDPALKNTEKNINNNSGSFNLILSDTELNSKYDKNLIESARKMFTDYNFTFTFNAPSSSTLTITDGTGSQISPPSVKDVILSGRRVSMSIGMMDLIECDDGFGVRVNW